MSPNVNPPANAAPPFRSSLRLVRFEPISSSFQSGFLSMTRGRNHVPAHGSIRPLPSLASAHEQKLADFEAPTSFAVFLRRGVSEPIIRKLNQAAFTPRYAVGQEASECVGAPIHRGADFGRLICGRHALRLGLLHRGCALGPVPRASHVFVSPIDASPMRR